MNLCKGKFIHRLLCIPSKAGVCLSLLFLYQIALGEFSQLMPTTHLSINNPQIFAKLNFSWLPLLLLQTSISFLGVESSLGPFENLQDPHYHCGLEKSCPEA